MAHIEKFNKKDLKKILKEAVRESNSYINNVDLTKSKRNYYLVGSNNVHANMKRIQQRVDNIMDGRKLQENANIYCSWVVSLPKDDIFTSTSQQKRFFQSVVDFMGYKYGKDNLMLAVVHNDETNPHMHVGFVPESLSRKNGKVTVSSASLITKEHLQNFHDEFDDFIGGRFNKKGLVKNGKTKGKLNLKEFKTVTKKEQELDDMLSILKQKELSLSKKNSLLKEKFFRDIDKYKELCREELIDELTDGCSSIDDYIKGYREYSIENSDSVIRDTVNNKVNAYLKKYRPNDLSMIDYMKRLKYKNGTVYDAYLQEREKQINNYMSENHTNIKRDVQKSAVNQFKIEDERKEQYDSDYDYDY